MRARIQAIVAVVVLMLPVMAGAQEGHAAPGENGRLELHTRTLLLLRDQEAPGVVSSLPIIQWLELAGEDLSIRGLSVHASLWGFLGADGGVDLASGGQLAGDVDLLFVEMRDPGGRYGARLGRQLVLAGPGQGFFGHIDGASLRGAMSGFELQAWGGRVVAPRFSNFTAADWMVGGRAGYRSWGRVNGGVSYLQTRTEGAVARHFAGADLAVGLLEGVDGTAFASWDLVDQALAEGAIMARYSGVDRLTVALAGRHARPGLLIDRSSIFSVFSLGTYAEGALEAEYVLSPQWTVGAEYGRVFFPDESGEGIGDSGNRFAAAVTAFPRRDLWVRLSLDRLPTTRNGYTSGRLAARWRPSQRWSGVGELFTYFYDDPPLSRPGAGTSSVLGRVFGEYNFTPGLMLGVGGELGSTVLSELDARALLRLTWSAELELGGVR